MWVLFLNGGFAQHEKEFTTYEYASPMMACWDYGNDMLLNDPVAKSFVCVVDEVYDSEP
jgi:hypothetical protein